MKILIKEPICLLRGTRGGSYHQEPGEYDIEVVPNPYRVEGAAKWVVIKGTEDGASIETWRFMLCSGAAEMLEGTL